MLVSRSFVRKTMGESNPLGRRLRYRRMMGGASMPASVAGRWFEIVGVVPDIPANTDEATVYHPMVPGQLNPVSLSMRTRPTSPGVPDRVRGITMSLDSALRVDRLTTLEERYRRSAVGNYLGAGTLAGVTLTVLLLSAAGIYALMSFTVNQRRQEIAVRSALGAQPSRLLAIILRRALGQVAVGAGIGMLVAVLLDYFLPVSTIGARELPSAVPATAVLMSVIGLLAAAGPACRGLRIDPVDELRDG